MDKPANAEEETTDQHVKPGETSAAGPSSAAAVPSTKLGSWSLDKSKVKKLGIKSSVLRALTKMTTKAGGVDAAPEAISLKQRICQNFDAKFKSPSAAKTATVAAPAPPPRDPPVVEVASQSTINDKQQTELQRVKGLLNQQIMQRKKAQLEQKTHEVHKERPPTKVSPTKSPSRTVIVVPAPENPIPIDATHKNTAQTSPPPSHQEMRGFRRQESIDSQSNLNRFRSASESEPTESGDNAPDVPCDPPKAAARFGKKTAAALGLDSDEADDEISDAESQRIRALAASKQAAALPGTVSDVKSSVPKAVRVRRVKQPPAAAGPSASIAANVERRPRSLVHDLQMGGNLNTGNVQDPAPFDDRRFSVPHDKEAAVTTTTHRTYTTTDDDEAEPSAHRPARVRRIAHRCRPSVSASSATVKPVSAAAAAEEKAASKAILSDNTVDFIVDSLERRCVALVETVRESFAPVSRVIEQKVVVEDSIPVAEIPLPKPAAVVAPASELIPIEGVPLAKAPALAGVVKINRLLDADRAMLLKLLKSKSKKGSKVTKTGAAAEVVRTMEVQQKLVEEVNAEPVAMEQVVNEAAVDEKQNVPIACDVHVESSAPIVAVDIVSAEPSPCEDDVIECEETVSVKMVKELLPEVETTTLKPRLLDADRAMLLKLIKSKRKKGSKVMKTAAATEAVQSMDVQQKPVEVVDEPAVDQYTKDDELNVPAACDVHVESSAAIVAVDIVSSEPSPCEEFSNDVIECEETIPVEIADDLPEIEQTTLKQVSGEAPGPLIATDEISIEAMECEETVPVEIVEELLPETEQPTLKPVPDEASNQTPPAHAEITATDENIPTEMLMEFFESPQSDALDRSLPAEADSISDSVDAGHALSITTTDDNPPTNQAELVSPFSSSSSFRGFSSMSQPDECEAHVAAADGETAVSDDAADATSIASSAETEPERPTPSKPTLLSVLAERIDRDDLEESILTFQRGMFTGLSSDSDSVSVDEAGDVSETSTVWSSYRNYFSDQPHDSDDVGDGCESESGALAEIEAMAREDGEIEMQASKVEHRNADCEDGGAALPHDITAMDRLDENCEEVDMDIELDYSAGAEHEHHDRETTPGVAEQPIEAASEVDDKENDDVLVLFDDTHLIEETPTATDILFNVDEDAERIQLDKASKSSHKKSSSSRSQTSQETEEVIDCESSMVLIATESDKPLEVEENVETTELTTRNKRSHKKTSSSRSRTSKETKNIEPPVATSAETIVPVPELEETSKIAEKPIEELDQERILTETIAPAATFRSENSLEATPNKRSSKKSSASRSRSSKATKDLVEAPVVMIAETNPIDPPILQQEIIQTETIAPEATEKQEIPLETDVKTATVELTASSKRSHKKSSASRSRTSKSTKDIVDVEIPELETSPEITEKPVKAALEVEDNESRNVDAVEHTIDPPELQQDVIPSETSREPINRSHNKSSSSRSRSSKADVISIESSMVSIAIPVNTIAETSGPKLLQDLAPTLAPESIETSKESPPYASSKRSHKKSPSSRSRTPKATKDIISVETPADTTEQTHLPQQEEHRSLELVPEGIETSKESSPLAPSKRSHKKSSSSKSRPSKVAKDTIEAETSVASIAEPKLTYPEESPPVEPTKRGHKNPFASKPSTSKATETVAAASNVTETVPEVAAYKIPLLSKSRKTKAALDISDESTTPKRRRLDKTSSPTTVETPPARTSKRTQKPVKSAEDHSESTPSSKRARKSIKDYFETTSPDEVQDDTDKRQPAKKSAKPESDASPAADRSSRAGRAERSHGESAKKPPAKTAAAKTPALEKTKTCFDKKPTDTVTCGNCKEPVIRKQWAVHLRAHYGQAWIDGEQTPLVMEPIQKVGNRMTIWARKNKVTQFVCTKCNATKKSGVGYLSHVEVCGLTAEDLASMFVQCPHCPSQMRQVSVASHLMYCSGLRQQQQEQLDEARAAQEVVQVDGEPQEQNNAGRSVRRSAAKAKNRFKELNAGEERAEDFVQERPRAMTPSLHTLWRKQLDSEAGFASCRDCKFTSNALAEMTAHFANCKGIRNFKCKACCFRGTTAAKVIEHAQARHVQVPVFEDSGSDADVGAESSESEGASGVDESDVEEAVEGEEEEGSEGKKKSKPSSSSSSSKAKRNPKDPPINNSAYGFVETVPDRKFMEPYKIKMSDRGATISFYPQAIGQTAAFHKLHFSQSPLYEHITITTFSPLPDPRLYLPATETSPPFTLLPIQNYDLGFGKRSITDWQSIPRCTATSSPRAHILYCGAAIQFVDWVPLPDLYEATDEQYLAIVTKPAAAFHLYQHSAEPRPCALQVWSLRGLPAVGSPVLDVPRMRYTVGIADGPLLCIAFMPSGGFAGERLAVAAVPAINGDVRLVGLPMPGCGGVREGATVRMDAAMVLSGSAGCGHASRISWSKTRGHRTVVAGYVTGMVLVWNLLGCGDPLLEETVDGVRTLAYAHAFWPSALMITQLNLHHDSDGNDRWMAVGSLDKKLKVYDLLRPGVEISQSMQKCRITSGVWPTNWSVFLSANDDAYWSNSCGITACQSLNMGFRPSTLVASSGPVNDMCFSDWLNTYMFVTEYGEIRAGYCRQMLYNFSDRHRKQRSIVGFTDVVPVPRVETEVADDDPAVSLQDGIVFCDFKSPMFTDKPSIEARPKRQIELEHTPLTRISAVVFNPNRSAFKLFALGYEMGFVRVCHIRHKYSAR